MDDRKGRPARYRDTDGDASNRKANYKNTNHRRGSYNNKKIN